MARKDSSSAAHVQRRDRLLDERVHDPYKSKSKLPDPTRCPDCGAVFHAGRWQWVEAPAGARETRCPACRRAADDYPAGLVHIRGPFVREHEPEVRRIVVHVEQREHSAHPLHRVMGVEVEDGGLLVKTTDMHLARAIGEALRHAHHGRLEYEYPQQTALLRVTWEG